MKTRTTLIGRELLRRYEYSEICICIRKSPSQRAAMISQHPRRSRHRNKNEPLRLHIASSYDKAVEQADTVMRYQADFKSSHNLPLTHLAKIR